MEGTSCPHDPIATRGPIGMYHCPDCGSMVMAGLAHPNDRAVRLMGTTPYGELPEPGSDTGDQLKLRKV